MIRVLLIFIISSFITTNSFSNENFGIKKKYIPNGKFYFGINPTGQKDELISIFEFLMLANQEKIFSDDKRYETQYGCKPRDCGNKGMLWKDNAKQIYIGVIRHSFWDKLDFSKSKTNQIFIFSTANIGINELPKEFKSSYNQWLKVKKISPSLIRYYNSNGEIIMISEFK